MSTVEAFKLLNGRRASILHVGGLRPTGDPFASNFGLLPLGLANEAWPAMNEKPMLFVCQMNLTAAPEVPALLQDIKVITFFVKGTASALKKENGQGWCLRAYKSLGGLAPIARPEKGPGKAPSVKRGFECRWEACDDYPNHDDPDLIVPDGFDGSEIELDNVARTKIGGYASSIQSEPWWGYKKHAADPAFCIQIESEERAGLVWGDGGTIYLARGTADGRQDDWFLDWQCY
jgi:hypothetical protein